KLEPFAAGSVSLTPPEELTEYLNTFLPVFGRRDTVSQARYYLLGLLSNLRRKNGETMEAAVPGATQQGVWDFLVRSPWPSEDLDRARVLDALQRSGCAGQPLAAVLDEVSWRKKGNLSVGVGRQYLGSLGKVDNGQVTVSLHGCHPQIDLPLLSELYLPEPWLTAERRAQAK
ncbi:transposase, partial [mine drainage metagenome]